MTHRNRPTPPGKSPQDSQVSRRAALLGLGGLAIGGALEGPAGASQPWQSAPLAVQIDGDIPLPGRIGNWNCSATLDRPPTGTPECQT